MQMKIIARETGSKVLALSSERWSNSRNTALIKAKVDDVTEKLATICSSRTKVLY